MDRTDKPVEILMAVYNGEAFLAEQIDSILRQSDGRWRLTVSDDGSTDGSGAIIDEYVRRHPDRIARHCAGRRFGNARDHFFHLMAQCEADYMLFCDQDDVWYPDKVARTRQALEAAEAAWGGDMPVLVFSDQTPTDAELKPLAPSLMRYQNQYFGHFDYRSILMRNVATGGAMGINRALARLGGRFGDGSRIIMHDWWLAVVAARFGRIVYIDESLGAYRQHGENAVGAKDVHSVGYIEAKLRHIGDVRASIIRKKAQAQCFSEAYSELLTEADEAFLAQFTRPRSGPLFYLKHRREIHGLPWLAGMMVLG